MSVSLRVFFVMLVSNLPAAMAQQVDGACLNRCTQSGSTFAYCKEACSYGQPAARDRINDRIAQGMPDAGTAAREAWQKGRENQRQNEYLRMQRETAEAQRLLLEEQRRAIQLENQQREAELRQSQSAQAGQGPALTPYETVVLNRWQQSAAPRIGLYPDFAAVVFAPDVAISLSMIDLMSSSPYAADIAYYLGKNKAKSLEIANLPLVQQADEIKKIEQAIEAGSGGL